MSTAARPLLALSALALGLAAAAPARADEPVPPDTATPDTFPAETARMKLVWAGLGTTAFWYGAAVGFSYLWPSAPGAEDLRVPVAGPWMALGNAGCRTGDSDCGTFDVVLRVILTTIDAVGQTGGLLVAGEALLLPTRAPSAPTRPRTRAGVEWRTLPYITPGSAGLGVVGRF